MGNTKYEIVNKPTNVPIYKICKLPKPGEEYDESHPWHTRVVHQNMFPLAWTDTYVPEEKDNDRGLPGHQACIPQGEAVKNESNENVVVKPLGHICENITLHPGLVERAPTLLGHDPLNLVLRGKKPKACITYLRKYFLIIVIVASVEKILGGGR